MEWVIKSHVTLLLLETWMVSPEIGPLCFWSLRLLWVLSPESVHWEQKSFLIFHVEGMWSWECPTAVSRGCSIFSKTQLSSHRAEELWEGTVGANHATTFLIFHWTVKWQQTHNYQQPNLKNQKQKWTKQTTKTGTDSQK